MSLDLRNNRCGVAQLEFVLVASFVFFCCLFIVDMMLVFHRLSLIDDINTRLVRHLATELGKAWNTEEILNAPWNGSCNNFISQTSADFLDTTSLNRHSMTDPSKPYYFGNSISNNSALVFVADSPYAILRMQGQIRGACFFCNIFPDVPFTTEASILVEFDQERCSDYP